MNDFTNQPAASMHAASALADIDTALEGLRYHKPDERSELSRVYAVTITQVEKAFAYFKFYAADVLIAKANQAAKKDVLGLPKRRGEE